MLSQSPIQRCVKAMPQGNNFAYERPDIDIPEQSLSRFFLLTNRIAITAELKLRSTTPCHCVYNADSRIEASKWSSGELLSTCRKVPCR